MPGGVLLAGAIVVGLVVAILLVRGERSRTLKGDGNEYGSSHQDRP
ncbi:hypothetical protein GCM10009599_12010 [Luteococcus peritonei]